MIVLASNSPRRKELLELAGLAFVTVPSQVEEHIDSKTPIPLVAQTLAEQKAREVAEKNPNNIVIGADTVVVLGNEILGKPKDADDAKAMLMALSGKTHDVYTGVALLLQDQTITFTSKTEVTFLEMTEKEILDYIKTGEPMDKAGAYGIQGKGGLFVEKIYGDYFNVVGLPIARVVQELKKLQK